MLLLAIFWQSAIDFIWQRKEQKSRPLDEKVAENFYKRSPEYITTTNNADSAIIAEWRQEMVSIKMSRISHTIDIVQQGYLGRVRSDMCCETSEHIKLKLYYEL